MKYAAPLKMNKEDSAITKVLGKAKYFGIYDDETKKIKVIQNINPGTPAIFDQLKEEGVAIVLTPHAGFGAIRASINNNIKLYYCGNERKTLLDAIKEYQEGKYPQITLENFEQYH